MQSVLILGRQPALGCAEAESLFTAAKVRPVGSTAAVIDIDPCCLPFYRLGGSTRLAKLLTTLPTTDWSKIQDFLVRAIPEHLAYMPEGKFTLGISAYGFKMPAAKLNATGLTLKKVARATGRSTRVVQANSLELSSAQVIHNQLTGERAWELLIIADGPQTLIAQTSVVQDIEAYAARDQARPKRDAKVGMLPPKLAQIIINLATGPLTIDEASGDCLVQDSRHRPRDPAHTVLDPFCGTGVVLQEALLMGYNVLGTDLEPRMIAYSKENLDWLGTRYTLDASPQLAHGSATSFSWKNFSTVAAETYLGRPFSTLPDPRTLSTVMSTVNNLHKDFLKNLATQTAPGFRACLAVPAWADRSGQFKHLPILDRLEDIGYNRLSFVHVKTQDLIYHREGQIVARELVVLERK